MQIKSSSAFRNDYSSISNLARTSGKPIFITHNGEYDGVFMSIAAYKEREKMYQHRDLVYQAELSRLCGEATYTQEDIDAQLEKVFRTFEI